MFTKIYNKYLHYTFQSKCQSSIDKEPRNNNCCKCSPVNRFLASFIILPALENRRSDGTEVAIIDKYFFASLLNNEFD